MFLFVYSFVLCIYHYGFEKKAKQANMHHHKYLNNNIMEGIVEKISFLNYYKSMCF